MINTSGKDRGGGGDLINQHQSDPPASRKRETRRRNRERFSAVASATPLYPAARIIRSASDNRARHTMAGSPMEQRAFGFGARDRPATRRRPASKRSDSRKRNEPSYSPHRIFPPPPPPSSAYSNTFARNKIHEYRASD